MQQKSIILIINSGSSSIKFAIYETGENLRKIQTGKIENIGSGNTSLLVKNILNNKIINEHIDATDFSKAAESVIDFIKNNFSREQLKIIGHRIVHGMHITEPSIIDRNLIDDLKKISSYDPDHLPAEIEIIEKLNAHFPGILQFACFDTSFHTTMPGVAKMFPLPRRFYEAGIQRYGFHGLSYSYLLEELETREGKKIADGKIIFAHLGNGASLAAVKKGKCVDTSMGFTPTGGTMMGTRSGDIDPGIAWYLMEKEKMNAATFSQLINHESGLLGVSGKSSNMQELLELRKSDKHAAEAVDLFCYHVKKWIGTFVAVLDGLDALVFSGGIGENASEIRSAICSNIGYVGIEMDEQKNKNHSFQISTQQSAVKIFVIPTDEELIIARNAERILETTKKITV